MSDADRFLEIYNRDDEHTHLQEKGHTYEFYDLLWEIHNGDDRCACLRHVIVAVMDHDELKALDYLRNCIAEHPAGRGYRKWANKDLAKAIERGIE